MKIKRIAAALAACVLMPALFTAAGIQDRGDLTAVTEISQKIFNTATVYAQNAGTGTSVQEGQVSGTGMSTKEEKLSVTSITTKEELLAVAANPSGTYRLDADIDMAGVEWTPFAFSGIFDGNGHAILNLSYSTAGKDARTTYDGNYKTYDTYFGGMFSIITEGAAVSNLNLINIRAALDSDVPVFMGSIAGFLDGGTIDGCTVSGRLDLTTTAKMFGVGGIVGYGRGTITNTDSVMTLVCIDEDTANKDEQFLGGAYATGYIDMYNCNVTVYGYDSDHGYVHNGGLTGMYMFYPYGQTHSGSITNCSVDGFITFFEDNTDRRAYCKAYYGELLSTNLVIDGCVDTFETKEIFDYSTNLLPDGCGNTGTDHLSKAVTASTDTEYGYTTYTCAVSGYTYTDNYTLLASDLAKLAAEQTKADSELTLPNSDDASSTSQSSDWAEAQSNTTGLLVILLCVAVLVIVLFAVFYGINAGRRKRRRRRRRR